LLRTYRITIDIVPRWREDVDPVVAVRAVEVRQVHLELVLELARLVLAHQLVGDPPHGLDVHPLRRDGRYEAVDLDVDRRAAGDEEVRGLFFGHQLEVGVEVHGGTFAARMYRRYVGIVPEELMIMS
jgi:hypothetical protein